MEMGLRLGFCGVGSGVGDSELEPLARYVSSDGVFVLTTASP
jgi:hypothetical protein